MSKISTTDKANLLIEKKGKLWLCDQIGISRPTIYVRLKKENWKAGEVALIDSLYENK